MKITEVQPSFLNATCIFSSHEFNVFSKNKKHNKIMIEISKVIDNNEESSTNFLIFTINFTLENLYCYIPDLITIENSIKEYK